MAVLVADEHACPAALERERAHAAGQVERELAWLYAPAQARVVACVGGMDIRREARALAQGAHIVVGTPGRLRDHLERGNLDISALRAVVLDEADEMLDLGFREDLEFILDATPETRRTLLFSATIPKEIVELARNYQNEALRLATGGETFTEPALDHDLLGVADSWVSLAATEDGRTWMGAQTSSRETYLLERTELGGTPNIELLETPEGETQLTYGEVSSVGDRTVFVLQAEGSGGLFLFER